MKPYPTEIIAYIADKVTGTSTQELVELANSKFNAGFTIGKMRALKANYGFKSGTKGGNKPGMYRLFNPETAQYLKANIVGQTTSELTEAVNSKFGTDYKLSQIESFISNNKLKSGVNCKFKSGHESHNKGKKGIFFPGSENGWFQPGHMPTNHRPVGSERVDSKDGYTSVKVAEPNKWRLKHRLIYYQAHGPIPPSHTVIFLDGNKTNFALENLMLIKRSENAIMNHLGLRSEVPEFTKTGILIAKVKKAVCERERNNG